MSAFWYILCPGELQEGTKNTFLDAHDLARHYKVPMARCLVQRPGTEVAEEFLHLTCLRPDPTGKWIRPKSSNYKGKK